MEKLPSELEDNTAVSVTGVYVAQTRSGPSPVVLLTDNKGRILPIFIGPSEAASIEMAMLRARPQRPGTHDLVISILRELNTTVENVSIIDVINGIYIGRLALQVVGANTIIDARPSDCIAVAVRAGCPIYVKETVMGQYSITKENLPESTEETLVGS
ncbi:MAG: bifunctional nuclease family protein [Candidatus Atabeyarchaeum deiterrae]